MGGRKSEGRRWSWRTGTAVAFASVIFSGCDTGELPFVMALEPFYTAADLESDARLQGTWRDSEGDVTFSFEPAGENGKEGDYELVVKERDGSKELSGEFDARIVHLGGFRFLDIYPRSQSGGSEFYRMHFVRAHTLARVEIKQDALQMAFLSAGWLKKKSKDGSVDARYLKADETLVLTGSTEELQEFVFRYANDDEAFADPLALEKYLGEEDEQ
jgi:hypothetical protein